MSWVWVGLVVLAWWWLAVVWVRVGGFGAAFVGVDRLRLGGVLVGFAGVGVLVGLVLR